MTQKNNRFRLVTPLSALLTFVYNPWVQQLRGEDHGVVGDREPGYLEVDTFSLELRCESDLLEVVHAH